MKNRKPIFSLIVTIFIAVLIILTGYNFLASAVKYLSSDTNEIVSVNDGNKESYVFYTNTDNDISLFPWNYSENAIKFSDYYASDVKASDIIDTINLYDCLRYYFYRIIPASQKEYIFSGDLSLATLMDFDNLEQYLTIYDDYYFFSQIIDIKNQSYYLNVSFNNNGYIYAFQCREIHANSDYSSDVMDSGNSDLTEFLNSNSGKYIDTVLEDISHLAGILSNYKINTADNSASRLNYLDENTELKIYDEIIEKEKLEGSSENDINSDISFSNNSSKTSYQIIKTQYEFLVVISDADIILHYDPIAHTINGFNLKTS